MSVVFSKEDAQYHGFAAEIANGCGLGGWQSGSQVVHTVAKDPAGPFKRVDVVVPVSSHNPEVLVAPDGTVVVYHLFNGDSDPGKVPKCETSSVNDGATVARASSRKSRAPRTPGCRPVSKPSNCNPGPCWECDIAIHTAKNINQPGPWNKTVTQIIGLANNDGLNNYNPSAHLLSNGSIALMAHTNYIYPGW